jgi:hypothetical protein
MPGLSASLTDWHKQATPDKACRSGVITLIFGGFIENFRLIARHLDSGDEQIFTLTLA